MYYVTLVDSPIHKYRVIAFDGDQLAVQTTPNELPFEVLGSQVLETYEPDVIQIGSGSVECYRKIGDGWCGL